MIAHDLVRERKLADDLADAFRVSESTRRLERKSSYYAQNHPGKRRRDPWTKDEIDRILTRELADRFLAQELSRSITAIQTARARALGLQRRGISPYGDDFGGAA